MKKFLLVALCLCLGMLSASATNVNYTADNSTRFANPERGFITMLERHANKRYAVKGKESYLTNLNSNDQGTLILVLYYLDEFKSKETLPDTILSAFDEDMAVLRNYGMKAILRFAYTNEDYKYEKTPGMKDSVRSAHDAPLEIIEKHLAQYKSHWATNADVIYCFQAGFVGQYGEWYYTDNFDNTSSHMTEKRKQFMDTLLKATPQDRFILLRTPRFKTEYLTAISVSNAALTSEEAFKSTPKARLGQHNDAFLNGYQNQGTYSDTATQKPWLAQETLFVPIGGECNISKDSLAIRWASHDSTVAEMSRLHWTFIQGGFSRTVTDKWRENGTFAELSRNMGYRYQLVSSTLPDAATAGTNININLQIKNVGYAPLYNERHVYIVLKNKNASYSIQLDTDPRTWQPNGVKTTIEETIALPADIPTGKYQLYLHMPDIYPSIAADPRYAVRFANPETWNESTGMNRLNAYIDINSDVPAIALDTISLPGTLNKSNVADYFDDTWSGANKDYYDFGSTEGANNNRWIEWKVDITQPGKYVLTETFDVPTSSNGHEWRIDLLDALSNKVDSFNTTRVWQNAAERVEPAKWIIKQPGTYTLRITNAFSYSKPKLKSLKFDYFGPVNTDTIVLPATFNKTNVADYSDDMTWYANDPDYFDFGPTDAQNLTRWARWNIELRYPHTYIVSVVADFPNGHGWELNLFNGADTIATYESANSNKEKEITYAEKWNLTKDKEGNDLVAGTYILEVKNKYGWAQPKLKSLTLEYEGELPTGVEQINTNSGYSQAYDVLGRPVDESYHGIVIQNGQKRIQ